ncbi:MAG TPA: chemotaxis protein CheB [Solirubrobacterales bacterium]|jgi:two-component system chemotaxis response regulator CheB|nr:chemotaxis protein CheB [Solirubrobacterales bacterium]
MSDSATLGSISAALEVPADESPILQRDVVVVGASAGGVQTLQGLVAQLPPEFPASVLVVLHLMSSGTSVLHSILDRAGPLTATQARDGEPLERAHIYVAPPDSHLLLRGAGIHLSAGPRENGHRPAIDPLFRSAARAYGTRAVGVILSGMLDDGTDGMRLIKQRGGACVVQDPTDAAYGGMPESAIAYVGPHRVVPLAAMGETLCELVDAPLDPEPTRAAEDPAEQDIDLVEVELGREDPAGSPTLLTCPDCGGVMLERDDGGLVRFACQVGHAYSPESLNEHQGEALESALWKATRTLDERADLLRRMARRAERRGIERTGARLARKADVASDQADEIRATILRLRGSEAAAEGESERHR